MTAFNGWAHDRFGTAWMLLAEALSALVCIALAFLALRAINSSQARSAISEGVQS